MMKKNIIDDISIFLLKQGYTIKVLTSGSFDMVARKEHIFLIKVLTDANSVSQQHANDMKNIAAYIDGVPLIIADKAGSQLADNIAYLRYGIYTFNLNTFQSCITHNLPIVKSTQAGFTAAISGEKLRKKREELGYSLNTLASKVGVSKRMIVKYEHDDSEITLRKAQRLYDVFGPSVFKQVKVFDTFCVPVEKASSDVSKKFVELGFEAAETKKVPFDVIAKRKKEVILADVGDKIDPNLIPIARMFDVEKLVIFKKKKPKDIPSITKEEFLEFDKAHELIKFLKEFE